MEGRRILNIFAKWRFKNRVSYLVAFAVALLLAGPISTTGSTVYASENSVEISQADIDQATSNLATVLEEAYTSDPNVTEETVAKNIMLYSFSEEQPASTRMKRSISSFSECMVIKMGLGQLKDVAKMVFNEQVVRYLKSQAWKKASAMIVQRITKFAGKKLASFAVKRLAHFALPGVGWVSVAWMGAQCGWDEIH
ncbi:hypothetical protein [Lacticaseibacillus paracasei]|uniref:hypothetical protein n=1 Tax=Lacticaseibacillus paracasei TaxID=1597 RepID=UPI0003B41931|nr:hypothetical protein [Lacticaseibacillus paracasei]ERN49425.1 hypothetical protein N422_08190 [Lacticaseibacillus paracasei]